MAEVSSIEVYEVETEDLYDGMFWPQLDGSKPAKIYNSPLNFYLILKTYPRLTLMTYYTQEIWIVSLPVINTSACFLPPVSVTEIYFFQCQSGYM